MAKSARNKQSQTTLGGIGAVLVICCAVTGLFGQCGTSSSGSRQAMSTPRPTARPTRVVRRAPTTTPRPTTAPAVRSNPAVITLRPKTALPTLTPKASASSTVPVLNVGFVADVTVPDDTPFEPGAPFTKTWRLKNTGTQAWPEGAELRWVANEQMGAPASVALSPAGPGETVDVSVPMVAPAAGGTHRGDWRVCADTACFGSAVYTRIVTQVEAPPTARPLVIPTFTSAPAAPPAIVSQPRNCCMICTTGKACGNTCISRSYTCHKGPGCACNAY